MTTTSIAPARFKLSAADARTELFRKSIHMMTAFIPAAADFFGREIVLLLLGMITVAYTTAEYLRYRGVELAVISNITAKAARKRDKGGMVLGPVSLSIGVMLSLTVYPNPMAAIAIYALAFGDGLASLAGKFFGYYKIANTGKTVEGSLACVFGVMVSTMAITGNPVSSLIIAVAAAVIELIPVKDLDNLLIPAGAGLVAFFVL